MNQPIDRNYPPNHKLSHRSFLQMALSVCILAIISLTGTTRAATLKWSYPVAAPFGQDSVEWFADGKGGVAALMQATTSDYLILWLDQNGREIYKKVISNPHNQNTFLIVAIGDHSFVYWTDMGPTEHLIEVDRQGHETLIEPPNQTLQPFRTGDIGFGQVAYDDKGFFTMSFDQASNPSIVRYSYD
ncbi:MAG TPA: hypothetical protein VNY07_08025 [Chthoniobacterales bacterium]|jgi:hypothetical protein|nr:hypothetical protein [Chthoniobacterales bacterium]